MLFFASKVALVIISNPESIKSSIKGSKLFLTSDKLGPELTPGQLFLRFLFWFKFLFIIYLIIRLKNTIIVFAIS